MEQIAADTLPPGTGFDWTALSYQEKLVGNQIYWCFGLALLLVYLVLAGQYESWLAPVAVLLAVPLSLVGPVSVMTGLHIDNNLYVQIGLILLIALSAKNAILIVEVARELRAAGKPIMDAALEAARARFRPILMTSFAFILGVLPLVFATGAGASARKSIGITVVQRHDRLDLPGGAVRARLLRHRPALRGMAWPPQAAGGDGPQPRTVRRATKCHPRWSLRTRIGTACSPCATALASRLQNS